jgi:hypothetical protein
MRKPSPVAAILVVVITFPWTDSYFDLFVQTHIFPPPAWVHLNYDVWPSPIIGYVSSLIVILLYVYLWRSYFKRLTVYKKFVVEKMARDAAISAAILAADSWAPPATYENRATSLIQRVGSSFTLVWLVFANILTVLILYYYLNCLSIAAAGMVTIKSNYYPFGFGVGAFYLSTISRSLPFVAAAALLWFLYIRQARANKYAALLRQEEKDRQLADIKLRGTAESGDVCPPLPKVDER